MKSISQMGMMYSSRLWIWKRHIIRSIGMLYVADAKSVWSWRKIVESSVEFVYREYRACDRVGNDVSMWFTVNI